MRNSFFFFTSKQLQNRPGTGQSIRNKIPMGFVLLVLNTRVYVDRKFTNRFPFLNSVLSDELYIYDKKATGNQAQSFGFMQTVLFGRITFFFLNFSRNIVDSIRPINYSTTYFVVELWRETEIYTENIIHVMY